MSSRNLSSLSCLLRQHLCLSLLVLSLLCILPTKSALASTATGTACTGSVSWAPDAPGPNRGANCASLFRCYPPVVGQPQWTVAADCDPSAGPCGITVELPVELPGNHQNDPSTVGFGYSFAQLRVENGSGALAGSCGNAGQAVTASQGTLSWGLTASCGDAAGRFEVRVETCPCPFVPCPLCPEAETVMVDLEDSGLCPEPPKEECPGGAGDCRSCLSIGGAGAPAGGGGGGFSGSPGAPTGPGARLAYKAGGAGHGSWPGSDAWRSVLGTGWSHDYAQRVIPGGDTGRVWLITPWATYRLFSGLSGDVYTAVSPSDEYRTLRRTSGERSGQSPSLQGAGWTLTDLDGTVTTFDAAGRWTSAADRFGNAKTATYGANGELERVDFPDGRHELFTYEPGDSLSGNTGKLATITEVGVDGTTSRTWTYTWVDGDLVAIDLPDGRAYDFTYGDPLHPGYLTRVELVGIDGGRRVEAAWAYDARGNVIDLWRGDASSTGPSAVDRWQLSFDSPALPEVTTVTDPLGDIATYSFGRDSVSTKPRLESLSGSCATCGLDPNAQLSYDDPDHPLRPTRELDGRGVATVYEYTADGQLESHTEADGTALQRTTTWTYSGDYPALVTGLQQPSTSGSPGGRETTWSYNASGALVARRIQGAEATGAFDLTTIYTPTPEGMSAVIDPPGYGSDDQSLTVYDPARGGLLPATRTDPLIGTTTFAYDPFNRRTATTDVNGVTSAVAYDLGDRMTFSTQEGATAAEDLITEHRYDEFGQLHQTLLPRGNVIEYAYDSAGRLIHVERKAGAATPGERVAYTLDAVGNRTREEHQRWDADTGTWEARSWTDTVWQSRCHRESVHHADGSCTAYAYDCEGQLEKIWDANHCVPAGSRVDPSAADPSAAGLSAAGSGPPTTEYTYDDLDRLTAVTQPWGGAGSGFSTTRYTYDVQDHLASVTDAEGNVTTYTTSDRDLLTREESPVSGTTTHAYNEHGELLTSTDARGVRTDRIVDALDRVTEISYTLPDPSDLPDPAPLTTTFVYDDPAVPFSQGRLTAIHRPGIPVQYAYDRFGRLTQDGDLTYTYDLNGNRRTITYPEISSPTLSELDTADLETSDSGVSYSGPMTAVYTFDHADRHLSLLLQRPGQPDQPIASGARYEPSGPLTHLELGNGLTETRTYTPRYSPESIRVSPASTEGTDLFHWTYTTDALGNPLTITDQLDPANHKTYTYQPYQYFLTLGNGPWGDLSWTYDSIGNRLTETRDGATDTYAYLPNPTGGHTAILHTITPAAGGLRTYTYGPAGHLEAVDLPANPIDFQNDAAGRLTRIERPAGDVSSDFRYDGRSFLTSIAADSLSEIFADCFEAGDGSCWTRSTGSDIGAGTADCSIEPSLASVYSSEGVLHAITHFTGSAEDNTRYYFYFADRPVAQLDVPLSGVAITTSLSVDHLSTPILAADATGAVFWQGGFEPFGADHSGASVAGVALRFPGQWRDEMWREASEGGRIAYNVHRWYQPGTGQYTKSDPLGRNGDLHPYIYAAANPLHYLDPLGEKSRTCCAPIASGALRAFKHCFIQVQNDTTGEDTVYSLHGMGGRWRSWGGPLGCTFTNDSFDEDAIGVPSTECGDWNQSCDVDACVAEQFRQYPQASTYRLLGPNSNTFAGTVTRACGLTPPSVAGTGRTPGWNDSPAPAAAGKTCPDRR
ncbi:MAG: RHS repeat-associated core domain-containing protein [Acidobacteriota bacterium]